MDALKQYIELFEAERALVEAGSPAALNARRDAALAYLRAHGLPGRGDERYRYVDVERVFAPDYGLNLGRRLLAPDAPRAFRCALPGLEAETVYVVGDRVWPDAPAVTADGVRLARIGDENGGFTGTYGAPGAFADGIEALGALFVQEGLAVDVPAGTEAVRPVQVVGVAAAGGDLMSCRRIAVRLGAGSRLTLLLCAHSDGRHSYLNLTDIDIHVGPGARLDLVSVGESREGTSDFLHLRIRQEAASHVRFCQATLSCGLSRTTADVSLCGPGATVETAGAVVADAAQQSGTDILVRHEAPGCTSEMLYKQVLGGESRGAFAGRVYVAHGAQQSLSQQRNANLLIGPGARAYAQPMLEIYADDVRCNHGSTTGKLDETALFYMRQRGIDEAEARLLLQHAFVSEVLQRIGLEPLRSRIERLVDKRFRGAGDKCAACRLCR